MSEAFAEYDSNALPPAVVTYLDARDAQHHDAAAAVFTQDATVVDDGNTYVGIDAIAAWIEQSSSEFTYTSTRIGQSVQSDTRVIVLVRIDGDFPGGTVTLRYQFELAAGDISRLVIEV